MISTELGKTLRHPDAALTFTAQELEPYLDASFDQLEDVISPAELVANHDTLTKLTGGGTAEVVGRYTLGGWLATRIMERFGNFASFSSSPFTPGNRVMSALPGVGLAVGNLLSDLRSRDYFPGFDAQASYLRFTAGSDEERHVTKRETALKGRELQKAIMASAASDADIHRYIESYDRLQASTLARLLMSDLEIEPLPVQQHPLEGLVQLDSALLTPEETENQTTAWEKIASEDELREIIKQDFQEESRASRFDPDRYALLIAMLGHARYAFGVEAVGIYRARADQTSAEPYYVVEVSRPDGFKLAIAETPIRDNATYFVDERDSAGTWQEVLQLSKQQARAVGAMRIFHATNDVRYDQHFFRIRRWLYQSMGHNPQ